MSAAACCLVPGDAELRSRNTVPGRMCSAASCATASVFDAVTAEMMQSQRAHSACIASAATTPACAACCCRASRCAGSASFRSQAATEATPGWTRKPALKILPTSP